MSLALLCAFPLAAQDLQPAGERDPFRSAIRGLPAGIDVRPAVFDADGDGRDDLWESGIVHLNDGRGRFTARPGTPVAGVREVTGSEVALGAPEDIVLMTANGLRIFVSRSTGLVDETASRFPPEQVIRFRGADQVLLDHDGDGDRDLVLLSLHEDGRFDLTNGFFQQATDLPLNRDSLGRRVEGRNHSSSVAADFDGDGFEDLVLICGGAAPWAAVAGGPAGALRNESANWFGALTTGIPWLQVAAGDFDGDGDPDLALALYGTNRMRFLANDIAGGRGFIDMTSTWGQPIAAVDEISAPDLDADGTAELLLANDDGIHLLELDANGRFAVVQGPLAGTRASATGIGSHLEGDFDGDGLLDLATWSWERGELDTIRTWFSQPSGLLAPNGVPPEARAGAVYDAALFADLNGDLVDDAVSLRGWILLNDGTGQFHRGTQLTNLSGEHAVAGDIDGDGDLDVVVASRLVIAVWRNDGLGGSAPNQPRGAGNGGSLVRDLELADLDQDGDLDLLVASQDQDRIYENDGTGNLTDATARWLPSDTALSTNLQVFDIDGDGDLDLHVSSAFVGGPATIDRIYLQANGRFQRFSVQLPAWLSSYESIAEDFSGDGWPDLVLVGPLGVRYLRNDSVPNFARFTHVTGPDFPNIDPAFRIHPGDLDADGDLDLVVEAGQFQLRGLRRVGNGYREVTDLFPPDSVLAADEVAACDLEGDGDLDVVCTEFAGQVSAAAAHVLTNRSQQLEAPLPARLGGTLELFVDAREDGVATGGLAFPAFAAAPASRPVPIAGLGVLRLDPRSLFLDTALFLGSGLGEGRRRIPVPAQPALLGTELHCQAIVAPRGDLNRARLTGRVAVPLIH